MYLSTVALFVLSQLVSVRAQTASFDAFTSPPTGSTFSVGGTLPIVWAPGTSTGTVSITLVGGATVSSLQVLDTVASSISSQAGSYNWTIPSDVGSFATYGLNLTHDVGPEFQYSFPFHITGGGDSTSTSTTSSSSASTISTSTTSSSASGSVSTTASGSTNIVQHTPSGTLYFTTTSSSVVGTATTTGSGSTATGNGTASKTSSSKGSSTSSASITSSTSGTSGASLKVVSGSLAMLSAFVFAFAL